MSKPGRYGENHSVLCISTCVPSSLLRGPALGILSMTVWATSDRADLGRESQREAGFAGREKRNGCEIVWDLRFCR